MYDQAAELIRNAKRVTAFTGAGISVESGIPPFRGEDGLWNSYDPSLLDINSFYTNPLQSWNMIKEIFYDFFGKATPNLAHRGLAEMENKGLLQAVITQNIDNLHHDAGSRTVYEFHGNSRMLICVNCSARYHAEKTDLDNLPPTCDTCGNLLKPDFVFFGEPIPEPARVKSMQAAENSDVFLLIGTTGEVVPAAYIPHQAKTCGARIIEMNIKKSNYTDCISDIFLQAKATDAMAKLAESLDLTII